MDTISFPVDLNIWIKETIKNLPVTWSFQEALDTYTLLFTWEKPENVGNSQSISSRGVKTINSTGFPKYVNGLIKETVQNLPVTWSFKETPDTFSLLFTWKKPVNVENLQLTPSKGVQTTNSTVQTPGSATVKGIIQTPVVKSLVNVGTSTQFDFNRYKEPLRPKQYIELLPEDEEDWQRDVYYDKANNTHYLVLRHQHLIVLAKHKIGFLAALRPVNVILRRKDVNEENKIKFDEYLDWVEELEPCSMDVLGDEVENLLDNIEHRLEHNYHFYTWHGDRRPIDIQEIDDSE